jgi:hypothetical protein
MLFTGSVVFRQVSLLNAILHNGRSMILQIDFIERRKSKEIAMARAKGLPF